jgi:hypothetical protein
MCTGVGEKMGERICAPGETLEGTLLVFLNCYYHVVANVKKPENKKKLASKKALTGILEGIRTIYISSALPLCPLHPSLAMETGCATSALALI